MNIVKPVISLSCLIILLVLVSNARADQFVSKIVTAYGGAAAIERARTLYARGTIKAFMRGDQGSYVRYLKRPGKLRVETDYSMSSELRVLDGKRGWRSMDRNPLAEVEGPPLQAMLYQYKETDAVYGLLKDRFIIKDEGRSRIGDSDVEVLDLEDSDNIPMKIYVDLKSYRILRTEGYFMMGGSVTSLGSEYGDFRKADGLLLPYRITNYAGSQMISETKVVEYRVNMNMPEKLFQP